MTDITVLVQAAIGSLFTNGLWLGHARDKSPTPYGVMQSVRDPKNYLSGPAQMQHEDVFIDIYADTYANAQAIADTVQVLMAAQLMDASPTSFTSTQTGRHNAPPDPSTEARRVQLTFSVWFRP